MFLLQILKMSILAFEACLPLSEETVVDVIQNDVPERQAVDRGVVCEIVPLAVFLLTDLFLWLAVSDLLAFCRDRVISNSRMHAAVFSFSFSRRLYDHLCIDT
jgi:hypothetical protein